MSLFSSFAGKLVLLSTVVAVMATIYLFRDSEQGANTATILSFTCSAAATVVAVYTVHAQQQGATATTVAAPLSRRAKKWTAALLTIGVLVPASAWGWNRWFSNLDVSFGGSVEVREDRPTAVAPAIESGWRGGELVFTPMLTPTDELSDCVTPAVLLIKPIMDGQPGRVVSARHGEQSSIIIPGRTRGVELDLQLDAPGDQGCVVLVAFRDSELRR